MNYMKLDYINEENKFNEDEFEELTEDEFILTKVQMRIRRAIMKQQSGFIKSLPIWEI